MIRQYDLGGQSIKISVDGTVITSSTTNLLHVYVKLTNGRKTKTYGWTSGATTQTLTYDSTTQTWNFAIDEEMTASTVHPLEFQVELQYGTTTNSTETISRIIHSDIKSLQVGDSLDWSK